MKHLVNITFADADELRIVLDNLNTHTEKAIQETFSDKEGKEILDKIEFHYTPVGLMLQK